jgi:hypothetical protein
MPRLLPSQRHAGLRDRLWESGQQFPPPEAWLYREMAAEWQADDRRDHWQYIHRPVPSAPQPSAPSGAERVRLPQE